MFLSVHPSLSIPDRDTFQLHLTPLNSTPTSLRTERPEGAVAVAPGADHRRDARAAGLHRGVAVRAVARVGRRRRARRGRLVVRKGGDDAGAVSRRRDGGVENGRRTRVSIHLPARRRALSDGHRRVLPRRRVDERVARALHRARRVRRGRHGVGDALHRADVARGETRDCFRPLPARPRSRVASRVRRTSRFAHDARCFAGETFD
eukprot:31205-Pelagococcus_subviridis.AAC.7